jgi:DNA-binding XRE family transcriptional regulator
LRSFRIDRIDDRRKKYLSLAGVIESQLRDAYARRHEENGTTQADLARKLDVNRSAIHHRLTGQTNMTIETLADMLWALDYDINVEIFDPQECSRNHAIIISGPQQSSVTGVSISNAKARVKELVGA